MREGARARWRARGRARGLGGTVRALAALAVLAAGAALTGPTLGKGAGGVPLIEGSDLVGESGPVDLTDQNFDRFTAEGAWLVKVYAPWCAHCKVRAFPPRWGFLPRSPLLRPRLAGAPPFPLRFPQIP